MSFSADLKNQILENKALRARFKKAHAYGLFMFSKDFSAASVSISTENAGTAELFDLFLRDFLGRKTPIASHEGKRNGKTVYTVKLTDGRDREQLMEFFGHDGDTVNMSLIPTPAHVHAFLSGAYLACGNITDPKKSYHIEYVTRNREACDGLFALLESCLSGVKRTERRGRFVVYYKEYAQIEDLLTIMGASKASLAVIEIEMLKNARNIANRATNCETANIDKLVDAAAARIEDIRLVLDTVGEENLPENLLGAARLRLEYPDSSLRELARLSQPPVSRSGIYHRLDKLSGMAAEIRAGRGEPE